VSLLLEVRVTNVFVKKLPNDHKNGPNNPPNQFYSTKTLPKSLGNFFLEKNRPMLKTFAQMAKFFSRLWSH
jgi:hypothetical protein